MFTDLPTTQILLVKRQMKAIFDYLKPKFVAIIQQIINRNRKTNKGPKIKINFYTLLDAIFELLDSSPKYCYIAQHYRIPSSTFARYLKLLSTHHFFENLHSLFISQFQLPTLLLTDTSTVCSYYGSQGTGYSYKIKSKHAIKYGLVSDIKGVIYYASVDPANFCDRSNYSNMIPANFQIPVTTLADVGYLGSDFRQGMQSRNNTFIAATKKMTNGADSHYLTPYQRLLLKCHRYKVEHLNAQLKNFRAITAKFVRCISTYRLLLFLGVLLITLHHGIIKGALVKYRIGLKVKI